MLKLLFTLFPFIFFGFSSWTKTKSPHRIVIPVELYGNLPMVDAVVNGQKGKFIFDTGASEMLLNSRYFQGFFPLEKRVIEKANGVKESLRVTPIKKFELRGLRLAQREVTQLDLRHIEKMRGCKILGLLGRDLFLPYELVIDLPNKKITLYQLKRKGERKTATTDNLQPDYRFKFRNCAHLPCLPIGIGNQQYDFGMDTGAETNFLRRDIPEQVQHHLSIGKKLSASGVSKYQMETHEAMLHGVQLGEMSIKRMSTLLLKKKYLNRLFGTDLDGILGTPFFKRYKVSINYRNRTVGIWLPEQSIWLVDQEQGKAVEEAQWTERKKEHPFPEFIP
ncbi:MAG: aspartyl protease family protein [Bacteroidota bacterium]